MRIALIASLVAPIRAAEANGPHAVVLDLARGLSSRGHDVTIYAARGSVVDVPATLREIDVDPIAQLAAVKSSGEPAPARAKAALDDGFQRLFDAVAHDRPDAVSQHAFDSAAIRLAEAFPVLHTLHLPPIDDAVVAAARATRRPLAAVSESARRQWRAAGAHDVEVLRNGVPLPVDTPSVRTVCNVGLIAGRISPEKGTHVGIRVARRAGLIPLVVGDVYDQSYYADSVRPLLRPREFAGAVPRAELWRIMAQSTVLLMPVNWEEPFGLVAAEAQMSGCPVVGYRRGALPEIVVDGLGGFLVEQNDEGALVAAVALASTLDRGGIREWARANLGRERMVDEYERALKASAQLA
jgi:glycosyltransferase involved in cell wall biosynthesis